MDIVKYSKEYYDYFRDQSKVILKSKLCPFSAKTEFINSVKRCTNFDECLQSYLRLEKSYKLANI